MKTEMRKKEITFNIKEIISLSIILGVIAIPLAISWLWEKFDEKVLSYPLFRIDK